MKKKEIKRLILSIGILTIVCFAIISIAAAQIILFVNFPGETALTKKTSSLLPPAFANIPLTLTALSVLSLILAPIAGIAALKTYYTFHIEVGRIIDENKALYKRLTQMAEMNKLFEKNFKTIGKLSNGLAHEFNNLLTPIIGYTSKLKNAVSADDPNSVEIEKLYDESRRAMDIIQKFTLIGSTGQTLTYTALSLEQIMPRIAGVINIGKPDLIEVLEEYDLKGANIMGNQAQLVNALINIITNAYEAVLKAKADGKLEGPGHIWLGGKVIKSDGKQYARISVKDDGIGMDMKHIPQIFEPYYSIGQPGDNAGAGLISSKKAGLGLTIAKNILDQHYADIKVESEPGVGTNVIIDFPVSN